ncbi:MAG: polysaccharide deacetylase family protein [Clostridia bacterium]|nr:polysaccharide deacetylase family protein [Clostridia bacterium]
MNKLVKFTAALFCALFILEILTGTAKGATVRSWFIKRNGVCAPTFPSDADALSELGCYYIDKAASKNGEKKLYLTFDAGYENGNIERILDVLRDKDVPAAFFVLKNLAIKKPDLLKRMSDEGHLICNHTANHKNLTKATPEEIRAELSELEEICSSRAGISVSKYFRFPEGKYSEESIRCIQNLGYKTVFWSFAYEDWDNNNQPNREYAINKIMKNTHDGAIILLHPTSKTNADIISELIDLWRDMGYKFYSLDEL